MRQAVVTLLSFVVFTAAGRSLLLFFEPPHPIRLHVRWSAAVDDPTRATLEQQLALTGPELKEGTTWLYTLQDPTRDIIRAVVQHPQVEDTQHVDRERFRPSFNEDAPRKALYYGAAIGLGGTLVMLLWLRRDSAD